MTSRASRRTRRRLLGASVVLLVAATVCVSVVEGTPRALPEVALGSAVLLHAERALALVGAVIGGVSVPAQAARGRLPVELSTCGLRYEAEAADDAPAAVAQLQDQFDDLVATVDALAGRLELPQRRP